MAEEPNLDTKFAPIGALWQSDPGKKSIASGSIYIQGRKIRVVVLQMSEKTKARMTTKNKPHWQVCADIPYDMDMGLKAFSDQPAQEEG